MVDSVKQREARLNKFKRLTQAEMEEANQILTQINKDLDEAVKNKEDLFDV